LITNYTVLYT